jgi:hypothetical protein
MHYKLHWNRAFSLRLKFPLRFYSVVLKNACMIELDVKGTRERRKKAGQGGKIRN